MDDLWSLEDFALFSLVKNFQKILRNENQRRLLLKSRIPVIFGQRIFDELNDYHFGIPDDILSVFTEKILPLKNAHMNGRLTSLVGIKPFLSGQLLSTVTIQDLKKEAVKDWIIYLDTSKLTELSLEGCRFYRKKHKQKTKKTGIKKEYQTKERKENRKISAAKFNNFPPFNNIIKLDLSHSDINDAIFVNFTKGMDKLEILNISHTSITNLCLLHKFSNLEYLDCSFPKNKEVYSTYLALLLIRKLKYLDISKSRKFKDSNTYMKYPSVEELLKMPGGNEIPTDINVPDIFFTKVHWRTYDFLEYAEWPDLLVFDMTGHWDYVSQSVNKFIQFHSKLVYLGLGYYDLMCLNSLATKDSRVEDLTNLSHYDKVIGSTGKLNPKMKKRYRRPSHMYFFLDSNPSDDEDDENTESFNHFEDNFENVSKNSINNFKERLKGKEELLCETLINRLDWIRRTVTEELKTKRELGLWCMVISCLDIKKSKDFLYIIKSCARIYLHNRESNHWGIFIQYFIELLGRYLAYFRMICNITDIYELIFDKGSNYSDSFYAGVLKNFLRTLDIENVCIFL
ncbi:DgyrCDS11472 [Dimorphilus gyrociliatus]|uniref:DgyrCDS11472 n=1 Tax=Dimorphilus gyrociliatus TaxID=2664684 RepID=A0A7I8W4D3_9ANNE|nr:DgyrCDS11472 [Dimorphilus gyrociliatus]